MVGGARRMAERLAARAYEGFTFEHHVFADETHTSVVPGALSRGLRRVFA